MISFRLLLRLACNNNNGSNTSPPRADWSKIWNALLNKLFGGGLGLLLVFGCTTLSLSRGIGWWEVGERFMQVLPFHV